MDISVHGLNISDDGNTVYEADLASSPANGLSHTAGLDLVDVSEIQHRVPGGKGHLITHFSWPDVSLPHVPLPVTIGGHPYLVEVDRVRHRRYDWWHSIAESDPNAHVGGAHIIDIANPRSPKVVSNMRLAVDLTANRAVLAEDPGASSPIQGNASHYCAVRRRTDPGIVACSFILSGLRVFDIHNPLHPKEVAYFNTPVHNSGSNYAMSAPAFDLAAGDISYSDGNEGFFAVKLTPSALAHWPR